MLRIARTPFAVPYCCARGRANSVSYGREEWPITGRLVTKPNILQVMSYVSAQMRNK